MWLKGVGLTPESEFDILWPGSRAPTWRSCSSRNPYVVKDVENTSISTTKVSSFICCKISVTISLFNVISNDTENDNGYMNLIQRSVRFIVSE